MIFAYFSKYHIDLKAVENWDFDWTQACMSRFQARGGIPSGVTQQMIIQGHNLDKFQENLHPTTFKSPSVQCLCMSISFLFIAQAGNFSVVLSATLYN